MSMERLSRYILDNVELWDGSGQPKRTRVRVVNGRLSEMSPNLAVEKDPIIDGKGRVLMPAGIDAQVHLRVPGQAHKETAATGIKAALKGGYAAVLTMPNTQPTIDNVATLERAREEVAPYEREYGVKVFWSAAITKHLNSEFVTPFEDLVRSGVRAFTNDGLGVLSDHVMEEAFARLETLPVPLLQHAEFLGHEGSLAPSSVQKNVGAKPYPSEPEWKMVERDINVLRKFPRAQYHVLHVSSRHTLDFVRAAKKEGLKVSAEVTPHHLFFNAEQIDPHNKSFKMNPPIRSEEDRLALWQALEDGTLDFVATDHAPHEETMKAGNFDSCAFGTIGVETTLGVLVDGLKKGHLTKKRFVEVFSKAPAKFLKLPAEFGAFQVGEVFHGILLDIEQGPTPVYADDFASLSKNSCFIGHELPGRLVSAFHNDLVHTFQ
jgi:dihydroorotase